MLAVFGPTRNVITSAGNELGALALFASTVSVLDGFRGIVNAVLFDMFARHPCCSRRPRCSGVSGVMGTSQEIHKKASPAAQDPPLRVTTVGELPGALLAIVAVKRRMRDLLISWFGQPGDRKRDRGSIDSSAASP